MRLEEGELKYMEAAQREHNEGIALEEVKEAIREAQARVCFGFISDPYLLIDRSIIRKEIWNPK